MFNNKWFRKLELLFFLIAFLFLQEATAQISGSTNPIICSDGTALSPCFTFQSAVNKGFYSPSAGTVGISIGGVNVGTWSSTGYSTTFGGTAASYFATGGTLPSITTGAMVWLNPVSSKPSFELWDSTLTANNRVAVFGWSGGNLLGRFLSDDHASAATWLTVSGGQAAGITGITSNSGSGSWAHTGGFSVIGTSSFAAATHAGDLSLNGAFVFQQSNTGQPLYLQTSGAQPIQLRTNGGTEQFRVLDTASATRYVTVTGSNGGNPVLSTSGGSLGIGVAIASSATNGIFTVSAAGTNAAYIDLTNTSGRIILGIEGSAGNQILTNAPAYSTAMGSITAQPFVLGSSGTVRIQIPAGQNALRFTSFTQATIGTHMTTNGDVGYCSDCTIANPCAGGGTGAIAKRLNGVNVCN